VTTNIRIAQYEGSFAKHCPADGGKVPGDYEARVTSDIRASAIGQSLVKHAAFVGKATFEGHVGDDARLKDFDIKGDYQLELTGHRDIAATGKVLERAPTQVYRGQFAAKGLDPHALNYVDQIKAGNLTGAIRGPKGGDVPQQFTEMMLKLAFTAEAAARDR